MTWAGYNRYQNIPMGNNENRQIKGNEPNNQLNVCTTLVTEGDVGPVKLV